MKDNFSFSRLRLLIKRQWAESKMYLMIIGLLIIVSVVFISLAMDKSSDIYTIFMFIFGLGGGFIILGMFRNWNNFGRSSHYLMIPASVTEKFVSALFFGIIIYLPAFILLFLFSRYILLYLIVLPFPTNLLPYKDFIKGAIQELGVFFNSPSRKLFFMIFFLLPLFFAQSVFIFSVNRFKKYSVQISILLIIGIIIIFNLIMLRMKSWLVEGDPNFISPPGVIPYDLGYFAYQDTKSGESVYESFYFIKPFRFVHYGIWTVIFLFLYLSSWNSLKEREL